MQNTSEERDQITESVGIGELVLASQKIDPINSVCVVRRDAEKSYAYALCWFHHESRGFFWKKEFHSKELAMKEMDETMERGSYSAPE